MKILVVCLLLIPSVTFGQGKANLNMCWQYKGTDPCECPNQHDEAIWDSSIIYTRQLNKYPLANEFRYDIVERQSGTHVVIQSQLLNRTDFTLIQGTKECYVSKVNPIKIRIPLTQYVQLWANVDGQFLFIQSAYLLVP